MSSPVRTKLVQALLIAGLLTLFWPRLGNVITFYQQFGKPPATSDLGDWLREIKLPPDASIVTSLQSYFPEEYVKVNEGQWQPGPLEKYLFQSRELPALYIEDKNYYESFFGRKVGRNGFNTSQQRTIHDEGQAFYTKLRTNQLFPYVRIREGSEIDATNQLAPGSVRFQAYANPYAFAKNLLEEAESNPLTPRLAKPSTIGMLHLTVAKMDSPGLSVKLEGLDGKTEVLPFDPPCTAATATTERFLWLDPPRDVKSVSLVAADGTMVDLGQFVSFRAYAALPIALNPTAYSFSIKPDSKAATLGDVQTLLDERSSKKSAVSVPVNLRIKVTLTALRPTHLQSLFLVFEEAPAKENSLTVTAEFEDGSLTEIDATVQHQLNPRQLVFRCDSANEKHIKKVDVVIRNTTPDPLVLKQIYTRAAGEVE